MKRIFILQISYICAIFLKIPENQRILRRRSTMFMTTVEPTGNSISEDSKETSHSTIWGRWWIRILLLIFHIAVLAVLMSLTPAGYAMQLGYDTGTVILSGTVFMWFLLIFTKTHRLVILFCILLLLQSGYTAMFVFNFRAQDRLLQEFNVDLSQFHQEYAAQIGELHIERIFEMLTPEVGFNPQELPDILQHIRTARTMYDEFRAQQEELIRSMEERLSSISEQALRKFRLGRDQARGDFKNDDRLQADYLAEIENLVSFLINYQGHYLYEGSDLIFDTEKETERYNEIIARIIELEKQLLDYSQRRQKVEEEFINSF